MIQSKSVLKKLSNFNLKVGNQMRLDTKLLKQLNNQKQKPISITSEILRLYQSDFDTKTTGIKNDLSR